MLMLTSGGFLHNGPLSPQQEGIPDLTQQTASADDRFGVILSDGRNYQHSLRLMGIRWYIDYSFGTNGIPQGTEKVLKVRTNQSEAPERLQVAARERPGSYWLIGNEPNTPGQDDVSPESYAATFHGYVSAIKEADPSAIIVAPEILNFDATCSGCPGFTTGRAWVDQFRQSYRNAYGEEPPIDVWSIHTYDLDWEQLPQGNYQNQVAELGLLRSYLDAIPTSRNKPIWLTEFSVLWGYDGLQWAEHGGVMVASPQGPLREDHLASYLDQMVSWLRANAAELRIQRWFLFASHAYKEPWATAPGGIALLNKVGNDSQLTALGARYHAFAHGGGASP